MKIERADLAIRLVEERSRLRYTQSDFADKAGMSREGLRLYEMGQRGMSAEFLAMAASLGVDVQYVLTGRRSSNSNEGVESVASSGRVVGASGTVSGNVVGMVQSGGVVHQIQTQKHVSRTIAEVKPGDAHISDAQAGVLHGLVNKIVEKEALLKKTPRTHRSVWSALNSHCGVSAYRLIASNDFEHARKYLDKWMGRLGSMATAPVLDDEWRKRRYAYIKINAKAPADQLALEKYLAKNFQVSSLTELDNNQLDDAYRYVAGRRSRARKN